jgi:phage RecT family recombinase
MNQNQGGDKQVTSFKSEVDLAAFVNKNYIAQLKNFFGDEKQAMKFLSSMRASVQKLPKLLECEPSTVVNSFMTMAQLGLMPSDVSGEAYVLPYKGKAQFQLGYQGLVTLFYRAGGESIRADIVRANDEFSYVNGIINHKIDIFKSNEERGEPVGAYAIAIVNGQEIAKAMNKKDILGMGENFSQSFKSEYSPWKESNDPELWMWKKTVLKQLGKLLPKNETINKAIALDNQESRLSKVEGLLEESTLKIGNLDKANGDKNKDKKGGSQKETDGGAESDGDKGTE